MGLSCGLSFEITFCVMVFKCKQFNEAGDKRWNALAGEWTCLFYLILLLQRFIYTLQCTSHQLPRWDLKSNWDRRSHLVTNDTWFFLVFNGRLLSSQATPAPCLTHDAIVEGQVRLCCVKWLIKLEKLYLKKLQCLTYFGKDWKSKCIQIILFCYFLLFI